MTLILIISFLILSPSGVNNKSSILQEKPVCWR
jgi:hypothetical protein